MFSTWVKLSFAALFVEERCFVEREMHVELSFSDLGVQNISYYTIDRYKETSFHPEEVYSRF
jgi:hypothetical protein